MLDGRLSFSFWTQMGGKMGIASQVLGSSHLTFCSLSDCHPLIVGLPSKMRRTTSHLQPSGVPAAGYQRDGKEEKAACSPLCHVPKVNIRQDRTHGFASLFFPLTLHPAAVQRTGNANWLLASVSLTFYPMMDSEAEVSEYPPAYPTLSFHPLVVNEAEEDKTSSRLSPTIVPPAGSQRSGREQNKLSPTPTIVPPAGSQRSGRGEHASHPPHEVHRLSPPSPVCPTRGSRHRPAWAHHPQA